MTVDTEATSSTSPARRRRGQALEDALLDAAWDELQEVGYAKLTMEGVAERAGTSRPVLARRWPTRPQLVIAALRRHQPLLSGPIPDTGNLRDDVLAVLRRASAGLVDRGPETVYGLLGDYFTDPAIVADLHAQVGQIGAEVMATILRRAARREEAREDIPPRVATLPLDLFRHEVFRGPTPPDEQTITQIVDQVFLPLVRP